jgi:hypothetical protein
VVDRFPLVVVVGLDVNSAVYHWLQRVEKEERWDDREYESGPVARETYVQEPVALDGGPGLPVGLVVGLCGKGRLLLAEAGDVHVDVALELRLDLVALNHLHDLRLLLGHRGVGRPYFLKVLVDFVLH